jgi:hypothetical protein
MKTITKIISIMNVKLRYRGFVAYDLKNFSLLRDDLDFLYSFSMIEFSKNFPYIVLRI